MSPPLQPIQVCNCEVSVELFLFSYENIKRIPGKSESSLNLIPQ
jgi:hypothetical protein